MWGSHEEEHGTELTKIRQKNTWYPPGRTRRMRCRRLGQRMRLNSKRTRSKEDWEEEMPAAKTSHHVYKRTKYDR
jgi:hypothetical protein